MPGYSVTFSVVDQATAQIEAINRRLRQMREPMERQSRALQQFVDLSGLKKVADSFTAIGRAAADTFSSMVRLVPVMGALTGAASLAGLANLVKGWDDLGQQLAEDSTRIGTTSQNLENLQNATLLAGGSAAQMTESLKGLTSGLGRAQLGDPTAAAWFRRLNIAIRDTNGNLRTATDVLPEVIDAVNALPNPMDRARAAAGLGADALAGLAEQFQRSGKTMPQWLAEARKFAVLTEQQQQALQRYRQATGELEVAFGSLKEQIGATLGEALTPLIKQLADWVQRNQPQIIAAVQRLTQEFAAWVQGIDWASVRQGAQSIIDMLQYLITHLDQVKAAAEIVAVVFATRWAFGVVSSIASVSTAIGTFAGVGTLGGVGLLGALGGVVFLAIEIVRHFDEIKKAGADTFAAIEAGAKRVGQNLQDWWEGKPGAGLPKPGETPSYPTQPPTAPGGPWATPPGGPEPAPGGGKGPGIIAPAVPYQAGALQKSLGISGAQYDAFGNSVAGIESRGRYDIQGGAGGHFVGRYQLGGLGGHTEIADTARQLGVPTPSVEEFRKNPQEQEKFFEAYTAEHDKYLMAHSAKYRAMTPEQKLAALGYAHNQGAGGAVKWLESGQAERDAFGTSADKYSQSITAALQKVAAASPAAPAPSQPPAAPAAPAAAQIAPQPVAAANENQPPAAQAAPQLAVGLPAPGAPAATGPQAMGPAATLMQPTAPPVSGSVDVNITHQRPPPGVRLSATATGDVNLSAPRTEQQQLSSVA